MLSNVDIRGGIVAAGHRHDDRPQHVGGALGAGNGAIGEGAGRPGIDDPMRSGIPHALRGTPGDRPSGD